MVTLNCKFNPAEQSIAASDNTECLATKKNNNFYFSFYGNYHPSFMLPNASDHSDNVVTVKTFDNTEKFKVVLN